MSDLKLPQDDKKPEGGISTSRVVIWLVGCVGAYLVISGVIGIVSGGSGG